jgi:hypothetical protein
MTHIDPHAHPRRRATDVDLDSSRPESVTADEARWYRAQRRIDINAALSRYSKRAAVAFVILFLGTLGNGYYTSREASEGRSAIVTSGRVVSVSGCNRDYQDREQFRFLLIRLKQAARAAAAKDPNYGEARLKAALDFYNEQLKAYPSLDCRISRTVVTDDPSKLPKFPEPCYRHNPKNPPECKVGQASTKKDH